MRFLLLCAALIVSSPAIASDEFGERFVTQTPTAFEDPAADPMQDPVEALSEIAPAAGDETADSEAVEKETAPEDMGEDDSDTPYANRRAAPDDIRE